MDSPLLFRHNENPIDHSNNKNKQTNGACHLDIPATAIWVTIAVCITFTEWSIMIHERQVNKEQTNEQASNTIKPYSTDEFICAIGNRVGGCI